MPKAKVYNFNDNSIQQVWIFCPGCKTHHAFTTKDSVFIPWTWNGDVEKPTLTPSMLVNQGYPESRCYSFVTDGKIQFLDDCFHELKNQTVDLPDIESK